MRELTREQVQELAEIDGPTSEAAFALFEAELFDGPVRFFSDGVSLLVDRVGEQAGVLLRYEAG